MWSGTEGILEAKRAPRTKTLCKEGCDQFV